MRLGFYINHLARLRDPEKSGDLEPAVLASLALTSGAQLILAGWTKTGGLINERDIRLIRELIHGDLVVIAPLGEEMVEQVIKFQPQGVILVASGWDGVRDFRPLQMEIDAEEITAVASEYKTSGVQPFALLEPEAAAAKTAARCSLTGIVYDASQYSGALNDEEAEAALYRLEDSALAANKFGLVTAIGHGLTYQNVGPVAGLRFVDDLYIGRSIATRALLTGIERAVGEMVSTIDRYRA
ncbi:pyridoxine 5'-phosphate synthase [bacterium]|nr:pyridoxine 5'-phosphate synthase [bacterium]